MTKKLLLILLPLLLAAFACTAQKRGTDRKPAVAGPSIPATPPNLTECSGNSSQAALPGAVQGDVVAIIVPHAGYVYSGGVAGLRIQHDRQEQGVREHIHHRPEPLRRIRGGVRLHRGELHHAARHRGGQQGARQQLIRENPVFSDRLDAQAGEHSVEVQVPFLQHILTKTFRIVPIVVGANSPETCRKIAGVLRPYLNAGTCSSSAAIFPTTRRTMTPSGSTGRRPRRY